MDNSLKRRAFLEFLGKGSLALLVQAPVFQALANTTRPTAAATIQGLGPTSTDELTLIEGLQYEVLLKWGDPISEQDHYGFNNDYVAFVPLSGQDSEEGLLWINHEYISPMFVSGYTGTSERTKEQVDKEMYEVGGTIVRVRKGSDGKWAVVYNDPLNRRITAKTPMPFHYPKPIAGADRAIGTLANCAGGVTPWGTILTCEENYDSFYGERDWKTGGLTGPSHYGWEKFYDYPPEHYGWVVEVDPRTGDSKKLVALGRCAHECATVKELPDGRLVVYTGDDANDECLYKFISSKPGSLLEGTLYVANLEKGRWESLDRRKQKALRKAFKTQEEVLIRLREASKLVGGSLLDRPEDIEIDPVTGHVLVALTNNTPKGNYHGSILKIVEENGQYDALRFSHDTFLAGGPETGFACPDNMAFDPAGNLWFTSDISGRSINKGPYTSFGNNGLFLVPRQGPQAGQVLQIASAPMDAELTGPYFSPDGRTLFLCVQHPGETSRSLTELTSHWPEGGSAVPKSAIVTISGPALERFQHRV
ncbi:PhoX family protein [Pontibacter chinhatensis]|uniref:Uncharacterized protein n=1 Tax=Pontibacter chinhatensis TaxID=1436961 RepID=A0A1I2QPD2_9BACT|nr:alkaline phosphatase PhoX [Pontibacter chinhatensis]SFG27506.1 hypothetical protein SAMN05421739_1024 [Pontibacter chinhatensis]